MCCCCFNWTTSRGFQGQWCGFRFCSLCLLVPHSHVYWLHPKTGSPLDAAFLRATSRRENIQTQRRVSVFSWTWETLPWSSWSDFCSHLIGSMPSLTRLAWGWGYHDLSLESERDHVSGSSQHPWPSKAGWCAQIHREHWEVILGALKLRGTNPTATQAGTGALHSEAWMEKHHPPKHGPHQSLWVLHGASPVRRPRCGTCCRQESAESRYINLKALSKLPDPNAALGICASVIGPQTWLYSEETSLESLLSPPTLRWISTKLSHQVARGKGKKKGSCPVVPLACTDAAASWLRMPWCLPEWPHGFMSLAEPVGW